MVNSAEENDRIGNLRVKDVAGEMREGLKRMFLTGRAIGMATADVSEASGNARFVDADVVIRRAQLYMKQANQDQLRREEIIVIKHYMKEFMEELTDKWKEGLR